MRLTRIELENYRNIAKTRLDFEGDRHFFLGQNGQGKTNILEAIAYMQGLESFRTKKQEALIMTDKPEAIIRSHWQHEKRKNIELGVSINPVKSLAVMDGAPVRTSREINGIFPVVALTLGDRELLYGGPGARRQEIDRLITQIDPGYHQVLFDYEKANKARNQLLSQAEKAPTPQEFESFESVMATMARRLIKSRERATVLLLEEFQKAFASFAPHGEMPHLEYAPNAGFEELPGLWRELRGGKDKAIGYTTRGPHRDNFIITLNGMAAELYASEGQKFSLVLALKLAGLQLLYEKLEIAPVLVCDDLLLELDAGRQKLFWNSVENLQVFASGTVLPASDFSKWNIWKVENGRITG